MSVFLEAQTIGATFDGGNYNTNLDLIEATFNDYGPWIISGLVPSAGTGLSADVTAGVAVFGQRLEKLAGFTISGLADNTLNHLYLKEDGTTTSNTSGTQPALSVKLGTATTLAGAVTAVGVNWAAGRQARVRHENLVLGGGAGHPGAGDLASWHATNDEGNEFKGVLPAAAVAGGGASAQATKTANYTVTTDDYFLWGDCSGGNITFALPTAVGNDGKAYVFKKIDSTSNTVTLDPDGTETIDGELTLIIENQWDSFSIASNGANWYIW